MYVQWVRSKVNALHFLGFLVDLGASYGVRAGKGGPEIALDTMNGDILIKKRTV